MNKPLTKHEEDAFYGVPATDFAWQQAVRDQTAAYDADDVQVDAAENAPALLAALADGNYEKAGRVLAIARKLTIKRRAECQVTGRIREVAA